MQEFLYLLSFAIGVATAIIINKLVHSAAMQHYEQLFYADMATLKDRIKALETPAPKGK